MGLGRERYPMTNVNKFFNNPILLKRCTGLSKVQFQELVRRITPIWNQSESERLSGRNRKRAMGAGHPYHLETMEEKLVCVLLWYKIYPAFWLLGMLLGFDGGNACKLIGRLRPLMEQAADPALGIYFKRVVRNIQRGRRKISSFKDLEREFPEIAEIFIDTTEQQRLRPKKQVQKKYYSGKKKRHTLKTQLVVGKSGRILLVSRAYSGKHHDYDIFQREKTAETIPKDSHVYLDRGFQGVKKDFPVINWLIPNKRNRWKRVLTRSEKIFNTKVARKRIRVEHVISRLKKYAILGSVFRNRNTNYRSDFRNIAALTNFRLSFAT